MAKIELRLSSKVQSETGRQEVIIRFHEGKHFNLNAKTGFYVSSDFFEWYIDRAKTEALNISVPPKLVTITKKKAESKGYCLLNRGIICVSNHRLETPEVKWHKEKAETLEKLSKVIMECYEQSAITEIQGDWLKKIVDNFNHPEVIEKHEKTFYELTDDYIKRRGLAESHARVYHVLQRAVSRYEGFVRLTDRNRKHWTFDINCISREDIEDLTDYLRNESTLAEEYPRLFAKLLKDYPNNVKPGHSKVEARGGNTIIKMRTRLKSLFLWFYEEGYTKNRPFDGVKIGTAKVGTPYYITIDERNKIKVAIDWINKLANGMNPLDGSTLPDSDIVNNVHISRCLFYVSHVLEDAGKKTSSRQKQYELEFQLTPEIISKVYIAERTGIAMFVKEINKVIPENMQPLAASKVTQWLVSVGYLVEQQSSDGRKYKAPTELGASIGMTSAWRDGSQGQYLAVSYDANAQHFILENLFKL